METSQQSSYNGAGPSGKRRRISYNEAVKGMDCEFFLLPRHVQVTQIMRKVAKAKATNAEVKPIKELLAEARLTHNQECTLYHAQDTCLSNGCQWNGRFYNSGQCVGPHMRALQLSHPPRIKDIVRLDTLHKELLRKPPARLTAEEDDQLFYLEAVKEFMLRQTEELQELMRERTKAKRLIEIVRQKMVDGDMVEDEARAVMREQADRERQAGEKLQEMLKGMGSYVATFGLAVLDFLRSSNRTALLREQGSLLSTAVVWMEVFLEAGKIRGENAFGRITSAMASARDGVWNLLTSG